MFWFAYDGYLQWLSGILLVEWQVSVQLLLSMFSANITFSKGINKIHFYMSSVSIQSGLCGLYKKCSWYLRRKVNYANWTIDSGCLREINVFMQLGL